MGRSFYGVPAAAMSNGGGYVTSESARLQSGAVVSLTAIEAAALTLETAVSTSLVAATTGASGVGSMDRIIKTALSASYSAVTASIY